MIKIDEDILNMLFEITLGKNKYEFDYQYVLDSLPYNKQKIMTTINCLLKLNILVKINSDGSIVLDKENVSAFENFKYLFNLNKEQIDNLMLINISYKYIEILKG